MTSLRSPDLQQFLMSAEAAIRHGSTVDGSTVDGRLPEAAERIFSALRAPLPQAGRPAAARMPVCRHLPGALENARRQPGHVAALAGAFAAIEPQLTWKVRPGAETHGEQFMNGHANAIIVGPEGAGQRATGREPTSREPTSREPTGQATNSDALETRQDVLIGVSLLAPHTRYPDHHHPPEEIYVVLSCGQWRQASDPWHEPGIGGLVYNPPNIVHAMRSADQPLLALWFLWTEPHHTRP